jgi:cobyrinic acid a,c-diamide synthase
MKSQLLVAATCSGSGKTTITMGLLRALARHSLAVQPFKCGPDYIDTAFHSLASGRLSVNLDSFMMSKEHIVDVYKRNSIDADVCVTEGVMGLFDGYDKFKGSSFEISDILGVPVVLVVNAAITAYSAAAIIHGFKSLNPNLNLAGVIFNRVTSETHFSYLKEACEDVGVQCFGYVPKTPGLEVPSRHLGLMLAPQNEMEDFIERAADALEAHVDILAILRATKVEFTEPEEAPAIEKTGIRVAIAADQAFNFTYKENLDWLRERCEITYFSPITDKKLPEADILYLPGGYPELYVDELSNNHEMCQCIKDFAEAGGKIYAECGGMIYLMHSLDGVELCNVLPMDCTMSNAHLHLGYRTIDYNGYKWKGHEFHYSELVNGHVLPSVAQEYRVGGVKVDTPLYRYKNVIAGYTHIYWAEIGFLNFWD